MKNRCIGLRCGFVAACTLLVSAAGSADAAMLHLTTTGGYASQQTTVSGTQFSTFSVELWVDDIAPGETVTVVELGLDGGTTDPGVSLLGGRVPGAFPGAGTVEDPIIPLIPPATGPTLLYIWDFVLLSSFVFDHPLSIRANTVSFNAPGEPEAIWFDQDSQVRSFAYSSSLLINPTGAIPAPEWTPAPGTLALLAPAGLIATRRRR